jgi:hypothetical protein
MLLKSLLAFVPGILLLTGSAVLYSRNKTAGRFLQLVGAAALVLVILTHIFEATHVFSWMQWGEERSPGHYLDLRCALVALILFPAGNAWDAVTQARN